MEIDTKVRSNPGYVFYAPGYGFGGLEMQMVKRANDAIRYGKRALVLCFRDSRISGYANELNVPVEIIDHSYFYLNIFAAFELVNTINNNSINYCVFGSTKLLSIGVLAKSILRIFYKKNVRIVLFQQMQSGIKKKDPIHNWLYRNLDSATVLTNDMKQSLITNTIMEESKVSIIPIGIDVGTFEVERNNKTKNRQFFGLGEEKYIIGYVARFDESKDQLTALKAFKMSDIPDSILILAGSVDKVKEDYYKKCISLIEELDLSGKVKIIPFTKEVPKLMSCFDLFIMPSRSETFGLVIIEAMSAGVPVIATNSGGVPEIIITGVNGLLFEPRDASKLADFIRQLYKNESQSELLINCASRIVKEKYDYEKQSMDFFDFIERIEV
jgi:glycosyltransferase involved in cell wall biosynthesis